MTSIIAKRACLHEQLRRHQEASSSLSQQMNEMQSLANLGTATAMIAHELNNLLTPIANYAELAIKNPGDSALVKKALCKAVSNCRDASRIMTAILALAGADSQEKQITPLPAMVEEVFNCLVRDFSKDRITVKIDISDNLSVWAVSIQLKHVLMNLILNARDAMTGTGGSLTISASEAGGKVIIEISDTGCGIKPEDMENIFKMFFTTKNNAQSGEHRRGCGLGLAFCKQVIDAHGGSLTVQSQPDCGTTFRIKLPKPDQVSGQ